METYWVSKDCLDCIVGATRNFLRENRKFDRNNRAEKGFVKVTLFENLEEIKSTGDDTEPSIIIELG